MSIMIFLRSVAIYLNVYVKPKPSRGIVRIVLEAISLKRIGGQSFSKESSRVSGSLLTLSLGDTKIFSMQSFKAKVGLFKSLMKKN